MSPFVPDPFLSTSMTQVNLASVSWCWLDSEAIRVLPARQDQYDERLWLASASVAEWVETLEVQTTESSAESKHLRMERPRSMAWVSEVLVSTVALRHLFLLLAYLLTVKTVPLLQGLHLEGIPPAQLQSLILLFFAFFAVQGGGSQNLERITREPRNDQ